jgi:hypothetical protein
MYARAYARDPRCRNSSGDQYDPTGPPRRSQRVGQSGEVEDLLSRALDRSAFIIHSLKLAEELREEVLNPCAGVVANSSAVPTTAATARPEERLL